nr:DUF2730 family protein [Leisingera sp. MMG026]
MDLDTALKLGSFVLSIGAIVYAFFANRSKGNDARFAVGSKRMDEHDLQIQALKQTVDAMPGKEDMHRLELAMSDVSGELKAIGVHMTAQGDVLKRFANVQTRLEDYLLSGNNK